jgi:hypothetical protein
VEKPGDFMDYADILDFPGYRAREKLTNVAEEIKNPEILKKCFLRGKVAYLFERYCSRHEITAMLLCVGDSVQNNPDLPMVIDHWIKSAHGETPEERYGKPVCLFLVLTKFDRMLEAGAGSVDPTTRWDNRYNASFLQFFSNHEWPLSWAKNGKTVTPFDNIFWLLNLGFADAFFNVERNEEAGLIRSLGLRSDQAAWVEKVRLGYLASETTKKHVNQPEEAWRAIVEGQDGGAAYIVQKLTPILMTDLKLNQLTHLALTEARLVEANLKNFYQGGDREEERKIKEAFFKKLAGHLTGLQAKTRRFGFLLKSIFLSDDECHAIFSRSFLDNDAESEPLETAAEPPESLDLESLLFGGPEDSRESAAQAPPQDDFARRYRLRLENDWQTRLAERLADGKFLRYFGFTRDVWQQLVSELVQGAKRLKVLDSIETETRKALSYGNVNPERLLWKQSRLASSQLADYVSYLGLSPSRHSDKERTVQILGRETLLFARNESPDDVPELPDIQVAYDAPYFQDWLKALYRLMIHNVDFAEKDYDVEQNARLGQIISANLSARENLPG